MKKHLSKYSSKYSCTTSYSGFSFTRLIVILALISGCLLFAGPSFAACSTPAGVAGDMGYNLTGTDEYEYCNGTNWISMKVSTIGEGSGPTIASGGAIVCAIKNDRTLWCWGREDGGELGNGSGVTGTQADPYQVSDAGPWVSISAAGPYACALKADLSLWCWGGDSYGVLGNGSAITATQHDPYEVSDPGPWASISVSDVHACALKTDGTAWCWGDDSNGQLGNGSGVTGSQPDPYQVSDAGPWSSISAGSGHTCGIKTDGTAWCWGSDNNGRLGNGSAVTGNQEDPYQVSDAGPWSSISAGIEHTCGIKTDGTAWCWGVDASGQLGNGSAVTGNQEDPYQVSDAGPWSYIVAINDGVSSASCGIKTNGTAWCWGDDSSGQLGNGSGVTGNQEDPYQVSDAGPWSIIGQTNTENYYSVVGAVCGIKTDGTALCWGDDTYEQLGNGTGVSGTQHDPYQISDTGPWKLAGNGGTACSNAGEMYYDSSVDNILWCDGTFLRSVALGDGAGGAGCTSPTASAGALNYDSSTNEYKFCDGTSWNPIPPPDNQPDTFVFTNLTMQAPSTLLTSEIVQINNMDNGTTISISGNSAEYRICADATCSTVNHTWATSAGTIDDGEYVQVRMTSSASYGTTVATTLTVGVVSDEWTVRTYIRKYVFVTSTTYDGNIGGLTGADSACAARATAGSLSGTYKAWLAGSSFLAEGPARNWTTSEENRYELVTGTVIATGWSDVTDGTLAAAIDRDEFGTQQSAASNVWTNVNSSGTTKDWSSSGKTFHCSDWSTNASNKDGHLGSSNATNGTWTDTSSTVSCNNVKRLYCFEQ